MRPETQTLAWAAGPSARIGASRRAKSIASSATPASACSTRSASVMTWRRPGSTPKAQSRIVSTASSSPVHGGTTHLPCTGLRTPGRCRARGAPGPHSAGTGRCAAPPRARASGPQTRPRRRRGRGAPLPSATGAGEARGRRCGRRRARRTSPRCRMRVTAPRPIRREAPCDCRLAAGPRHPGLGRAHHRWRFHGDPRSTRDPNGQRANGQRATGRSRGRAARRPPEIRAADNAHSTASTTEQPSTARKLPT